MFDSVHLFPTLVFSTVEQIITFQKDLQESILEFLYHIEYFETKKFSFIDLPERSIYLLSQY